MLSVLDAQWIALPPSRTYSRRWCFWVPGASFVGRDSDGRQYGAAIHQQSGTRSGNRITRDHYAIEYMGPVPGAMGYSFAFEHLGTPERLGPNENPGPYLVTVGPNIHDCNCTAAGCKQACCKHRSAVLVAIREGLVDGVEPWEGMRDHGADE